MRVSHGEGLAPHTYPESCGSAREGRRLGRPRPGAEALTGKRAGRPLSRDISLRRDAHAVANVEGNTAQPAMARVGAVPRGQRPRACTEVSPTGIERSHDWPRLDGGGVRAENPMGALRR